MRLAKARYSFQILCFHSKIGLQASKRVLVHLSNSLPAGGPKLTEIGVKRSKNVHFLLSAVNASVDVIVQQLVAVHCHSLEFVQRLLNCFNRSRERGVAPSVAAVLSPMLLQSSLHVQ
jgi:hypothetical protein